MNSLEALRQSKSIYAEHRKLKMYSIAAGLGVISFIILRTLASLALNNIPPLHALALESNTFTLSVTTLISVGSIGVPFLTVYRFTKRISFGPLLPLGRPRSYKDMALLTVGGFAACIGAGIVSAYFSSYIQHIFGVSFTYQMDVSPKTPVDTLLYFVAYAMVPALLEEFALRGVVMQPLRRYGDWFAILMSSLVFALMHGNMVQLPFAFLSGLAIGFAVIRSGTMWTGIFIHFLNNFSSLVQSIYIDRASSQNSALIIYIYYAIVLLAGSVCILLYLNRAQKQERERRQALYPFALPPRRLPLLHSDRQFPASVCIKRYVSTIPMLAAIAILVFETISTITFTR